jgi:hypothetical protein
MNLEFIIIVISLPLALALSWFYGVIHDRIQKKRQSIYLKKFYDEEM